MLSVAGDIEAPTGHPARAFEEPGGLTLAALIWFTIPIPISISIAPTG